MKLRWFILSIASVVLLSSPARATQLESWHFDSSRNQLDLTTDNGVKPRAFVIHNPSRLVIDLPGTSPETDYTNRESFGGAVKEIRVGKLDDGGTRLVVELAPGYTVSPENLLVKGDSPSHWTIKFSSIKRGQAPTNNSEEQFPVTVGSASEFAGVMSLNREMSQLKSKVRSLMSRYNDLTPGMFFLDLQTGNYIDINGEKVFPAASTIKYPILVALFQEVDAGRVKLNEQLTIRGDLKAEAEGSGELQFKPVGTKLSVLQTATMMISISDNTATNMIIDRLGGKAALNKRFRSWGLQNTVIRHLLGDFKGSNTTSPKDLVRLSALISNKQLISASSNAKVMDIMRRCENKTLLTAGLGSGAVIAHKTGTLGILLGDAGIIQTRSGKRYLAGIMVRRPFNDLSARDFIRQVSGLVYSYVDQSQTASLP